MLYNVPMSIAQTNMILHESITTHKRMAWGLAEVSSATGLSVNFLRYEVTRGNLPVKRFGRRVLIRNEDLMTYLENGSKGQSAAAEETR